MRAPASRGVRPRAARRAGRLRRPTPTPTPAPPCPDRGADGDLRPGDPRAAPSARPCASAAPWRASFVDRARTATTRRSRPPTSWPSPAAASTTASASTASSAGFVIQAGDPQTKENHGDFAGLGTGGPATSSRSSRRPMGCATTRTPSPWRTTRRHERQPVLHRPGRPRRARCARSASTRSSARSSRAPTSSMPSPRFRSTTRGSACRSTPVIIESIIDLGGRGTSPSLGAIAPNRRRSALHCKGI